MKLDEIWMIHYEDDLTFERRLAEAQDLINRYHVLTGDGYLEICKDKNIPAGRREDISIDEKRPIKNYLKIPFYK